jgi:hypothetical protein
VNHQEVGKFKPRRTYRLTPNELVSLRQNFVSSVRGTGS